MHPQKTIFLCADDYGLNAPVSQGIYQLAKEKKLSAVSCLVTSEDFSNQAAALHSLSTDLAIGLHFNLTEANLLEQSYTLPNLLFRSHLHLLDRKFIQRCFLNQLELFVQHFNRLPDFIDGHQHVHTFPVIRNILLDNCPNSKILWRSTWPAPSKRPFNIKNAIIALSGGRAFLRSLKQRQKHHNAYFSGIYDFNPNRDYRRLFCQWLSVAKDNTLIMCHPAEALMPHDPIAEARVNEFNYLKSDEFAVDCQQYGIRLQAFRNKD